MNQTAPADNTKSSGTSLPTARSHIYHSCRKAILTIDWLPGQSLSPAKLIEITGSRAAVTDSLKILAEEGYLSKAPNSTYKINRWSYETIKLQFEARIYLMSSSISEITRKIESNTVNQAALSDWKKFIDYYIDPNSGWTRDTDTIITASRTFFQYILAVAQIQDYLQFYQRVDLLCYPRIVTMNLSQNTQDMTIQLYSLLYHKILLMHEESSRSIVSFVFYSFVDTLEDYLNTNSILTLDHVGNVQYNVFEKYYIELSASNVILPIDLIEAAALSQKMSKYYNK